MSTTESALAHGAHEAMLHVAIDGPAGAGKSTVGLGLARALGCPYVDTGLMYRAVTWLALRAGIDLEDAAALQDLARSTVFSLDRDADRLLINGEPPDPMLRSPQVDSTVSIVSAHPPVREAMVERQVAIARGHCVVMVGRDIGTVVLPDAPVKLWVTASPAERARRRMAEHLPGSAEMTEDEMVRQIVDRDALDSGRAASPLKRAPDAVEVETDRLTPEEALETALQAVREALGRTSSSAR